MSNTADLLTSDEPFLYNDGDYQIPDLLDVWLVVGDNYDSIISQVSKNGYIEIDEILHLPELRNEKKVDIKRNRTIYEKVYQKEITSTLKSRTPWLEGLEYPINIVKSKSKSKRYRRIGKTERLKRQLVKLGLSRQVINNFLEVKEKRAELRLLKLGMSEELISQFKEIKHE